MAPPYPSREPSPQAWRSLRAVFTVQTQNAFNDNVVRFALMGIAFVVLQDNQKALESYKNLIGALISLPFALFAPIAGWTSDRFSKRQVLQACLYAQIVIMAAIMGAILLGNLWLATAGFFVLAIQSAFFGPAKLGIMKELVGSRKLAAASGWMQMLTIVAIVFGSPAGGGGYKAARTHITADPWLAGLVPVGVIAVFAIFALFIVRRVQPTPAYSQEPFTAAIFFRHFTDLREVYRSRPVWWSSIGIAYFWFAGAFAIAVFTQIAQEHYSGDTAAAVASYCLASTGVGIMAGSVFVAIISSNRIELGLVPLGAVGMAASLLLASLFPPGGAFYLALGLLGATSAVFLVPQNAYLQDKADPTRRGRVLSASNLINSVTAIAANVVQLVLQQGGFSGVMQLWWPSGEIEITSEQQGGLSGVMQLWLLAGLSLGAALYSLKLLPTNFLRILLKMILRLLYRLRVSGEPHIPESGGALLLANHTTWIDGLLIGAACSRDVRFVASEGFLKRGFIAWGLRRFGVIPISSKTARHAIMTTADLINAGHLVCLFPEGTLTRTGCLSELQKGFELIARRAETAPVIPVYLDHLWGSIFSFSENKFFFKRPHKIPYRASIHFGTPIPANEAKRERVRHALLSLGVEAYRQRPELQSTLDRACIDALKTRRRRVCLVDRSALKSTVLTRHMILTTAHQLGEHWRKAIPEPRVALALPPGSPGMLAHLGLIFAGKTIVNFPLQGSPASQGILAAALREAGIKTVITTKAIHDNSKEPSWPEQVIDFTKELRALHGPARLKAAITTAIMPRWWLKRSLALRPEAGERSQREAVGVLTSTGNFHFLSHRELLTQTTQISETNAFCHGDVLLNLYPYHTTAGQLFGIWLPLLRQLPIVVQTMGSHRTSPDVLINEEKVTVIVSDSAGMDFCRQALAEPGCAVRMIMTLDPWRPNDIFHAVTADHPDIAVGYAAASDPLGILLSLSAPNPKVEAANQVSHRDGAAGRVLPGMLMTSEGNQDQPQPFWVRHPGFQHDDALPAGLHGYIDSQGFLFPSHDHDS